jgi:urease accessory protein
MNKAAIRRWTSFLCMTATVLLLTRQAHAALFMQAHIVAGESGGFASGFKHPWSGWDHICAMVAVGLWGAQLEMPAIWVLPVTFPVIMAFGGFLGLIGVPFPGDEIGIAASAIVLGLMVLLAARPPLPVAMVLVGLFGLFHGYAHGHELPPGQSGLLYSIGFVIATGTLHACGITIGLVHRWKAGRAVIRVAGAAITAAGFFFLFQAFHPEPEPPSAKPAVGLRLLSPSPGTSGEGRGEGLHLIQTTIAIPKAPHPNPLPEYQERGPELILPSTTIHTI